VFGQLRLTCCSPCTADITYVTLRQTVCHDDVDVPYVCDQVTLSLPRRARTSSHVAVQRVTTPC